MALTLSASDGCEFCIIGTCFLDLPANPVGKQVLAKLAKSRVLKLAASAAACAYISAGLISAVYAEAA